MTKLTVPPLYIPIARHGINCIPTPFEDEICIARNVDEQAPLL